MTQLTVMVAECTRGNVHTQLVDNSLHELQKLVGGYIEPFYLEGLSDHGIVMLANEEGILENLRVNDNLLPFFFVGWLVFVGAGEEDFISLTNEQIDYIYDWLGGLDNVRD